MKRDDGDVASHDGHEDEAGMEPETWFAPAVRASAEQVSREARLVAESPVTETLLQLVDGLLAILNEQRQIIGVNRALAAHLGIDDELDACGLRHGEAMRCVHADEEPAGCGTTRHCSSCGAAIAIVTSLAQNETVERTCAIERGTGAGPQDLYFRVRAAPVSVRGQRLVLLFLDDITREQELATMERVFFHDVNNVLQYLMGTIDLGMLGRRGDPTALLASLRQIAERLASELNIQRSLLTHEDCTYEPARLDVPVAALVDELAACFKAVESGRKRVLRVASEFADEHIVTDRTLVHRVVGNMFTNALEASREGEEIRLTARRRGDHLRLEVWNGAVIDDATARRVFQRNFSTKGSVGRGLGTYSMKLFGERVLGGKVGFESSPGCGTTFWLELPRSGGAGW